VDDVPLLLARLERMGVPSLLDTHFPAHGNRQGLSLGWVCAIWLAHILSRADHRLNQVRAWAEQLPTTLASFLPAPLRPINLTDDRLADGLRALSDDTRWAAYEGAMNGHLLRVYDLRPTTKACTRQVGVCAIFKHFSGFEFFLHLKHCPRPPTCG